MIEEKINILDFFDDNISNLDITKNYIYVLKLVDDRYYVGRTSNILRRIKEHFTEGGSIYTKKYKPLKVIEIEEEKTRDDERIKTLSIMEKYGWEKVRGACWCCIEIKKPNIEKNRKLKPKKEIKIIPNDNDEKIKFLYSIENENIIETGKILDISPGLVANRLEKLDIIKRKQLARGYFEYVESDLYKQNIERRNKEKEYKKLEDNFDINENKKVNLHNIKNVIREKYINAIKV
jgi:predicted GIY-YIG superfamily endonuclease